MQQVKHLKKVTLKSVLKSFSKGYKDAEAQSMIGIEDDEPVI